MTVDLTSHLKTCRRSHPHEEMDDDCERYTEYERELASLRHDIERSIQRNTELLAENDALRAEKERNDEQHRMELAAVSSACFANSRTSTPPMEVTNPYWTQSYQDVVNAVAREMNQRERAEKAEARALEYKTEHAALLGTSQWQEVEIADLRDDVKRLMQTVSECEERALANEKDAERWKWARYNGVLKRGKPMDTYFIYNDEADQYADAAIGAKHD